MRIYISHSTSFDYQSLLYKPLKDAFKDDPVELFLPHESDPNGVNSREVISSSDIVLAETSYASTGQGIELGWAYDSKVPIICFSKAGSKPSGSLRFISNRHLTYSSLDEMVSSLREVVLR